MRFPLSLLLLLVLFACANPAKDYQILSLPSPMENETERAWEAAWLSVPENRKSSNSRQITIPFIFSLVADSLREIDVPILIMSGGPGNGSLHMANGFTYSAVGSRADVLVMDQRGTNFATPYLSCPEIDSARIQGLKKGLYGEALDDLHYEAVGKCYDRWQGDGVDLNGYHTLESVEDIEALREHLELERFILYGMSYSCKLMAAYANTYPERVAALILDSPLPHESNYDEEAYAVIDSVFHAVLVHYSGSEELYGRWTNYIEAIQDSVFSMKVDSLDLFYTSEAIIDAALNPMGGHGSLPLVTETVERLIEGDHEAVSEILSWSLSAGRQAKGMRYSTWIAEELPDEDPDRIRRNAEAIPWLRDYPVNDVSFETANHWKVSSVFQHWDWPDLPYIGPVLILSGSFDPWTPVDYGRKMLEKFPQGQLNIYPEKTHLPGFSKQGSGDILEFVQ